MQTTTASDHDSNSVWNQSLVYSVFNWPTLWFQEGNFPIFWLSLLLWSSYRFLAYDQATTLPSNDLKYLDSKLKSSCVKNWNSIHVPLVNNIAYSIFLSWPRKDSAFLDILKFRFSKKITKFETISYMIWCALSKCQIKWEIVSNFCGLFRVSEL